MATDDLKSHATSTTADFYDLLALTPGTTDQEAIRRAYRKTALKYHPDKVGTSDNAALEKFHLLQIAYEILSSQELKDLYDNARRAREQVKEREQLLSARRTEMKDDLERREREGASGVTGKRKWGADDEWAQELARMREDTKRRRVELEEKRRQEMEVLMREEESGNASEAVNGKADGRDGVEEMERSVKVRLRAEDSSDEDKEAIRKAFERFGPVDDVIIRSRPPTDSSKKKKRQHKTVLVVFRSVVGAHAAVSDLEKQVKKEPDVYGRFEKVEWATGREPDFVPKQRTHVEEETTHSNDRATRLTTRSGDAPDGEERTKPSKGASVPKFSFKGTKDRGASLDEITMIRLKNAEKRRLEAKIRAEEAAADAGDVPAEA
ncbi:uncharacterized protein LTR77_007443 [Saxophila tyrrhenica]|uniref:J domain-containing protein n=1 Tax=Saxophila tyrrhenica TaxID=1690608 RepID=A0AAV9P4K2_9PEZI|nr:hypothetical protein LTR77_007443 [Saxophila tyrrhenica]